ncbi:hypothetical protein BDY21DRAFT_354207 [Lineolata rhizophorae]|uniref:Uncharacterized protein n=1 Tax=Lineolata rhizophorae TaxID=578093 RepID=A0A6A6NRT0_9PEZI|nr:hypothetical protein BDY21DRAFT_354207 [Lineolata rhizophorae]
MVLDPEKAPIIAHVAIARQPTKRAQPLFHLSPHSPAHRRSPRLAVPATTQTPTRTIARIALGPASQPRVGRQTAGSWPAKLSSAGASAVLSTTQTRP